MVGLCVKGCLGTSGFVAFLIGAGNVERSRAARQVKGGFVRPCYGPLFPARAKRAPSSAARASRARNKGTVTWVQIGCLIFEIDLKFYVLFGWNCSTFLAVTMA